MGTTAPLQAVRSWWRGPALGGIVAAVALAGCGTGGTPEDAAPTATSSDPVPTLPSEAGPSGRIYHSLVSDGDRLYVFGGLERHGWKGGLNDVWAYAGSEESWEALGASDPTDVGDPAYDAESGRFVMLAGDGGTWAYDPVARAWEQRDPAASPSPRCGERTVYDAQSDRVVLFGGFACTSASDPGLDDTWTYDYNTDTWEQQSPDSSPPGRMFHDMVYDEAADRTVLWGGRADDVRVWVYDVDSDTWMPKPGQGGPGQMRAYHAMSYDPASELVLMFGGLELSHPLAMNGELMGDMWTYDVVQEQWTEVAVESAPEPRSLHRLTFDPSTGSHVMFGGEVEEAYSDSVTDEVWAFNPTKDEWSGPVATTTG
jgi:Galactose oxidase, central domain